MTPSMFIKAMVKDGNVAKGSLGEGDATSPLRNTFLCAGLIIDAISPIPRNSLRGRGDHSVPSWLPNINAGDLSPEDTGTSSSVIACQKALLSWASAVSPARGRGAGLVAGFFITPGDSLTGLRNPAEFRARAAVGVWRRLELELMSRERAREWVNAFAGMDGRIGERPRGLLMRSDMGESTSSAAIGAEGYGERG